MKKTLLTLALAAGLTSFAGNAKADVLYGEEHARESMQIRLKGLDLTRT